MVGTMGYWRKHFIDLGSDIDSILVRDEGALATSIFGSDMKFVQYTFSSIIGHNTLALDVWADKLQYA